jgi:hypothetical protein
MRITDASALAAAGAASAARAVLAERIWHSLPAYRQFVERMSNPKLH